MAIQEVVYLEGYYRSISTKSDSCTIRHCEVCEIVKIHICCVNLVKLLTIQRKRGTFIFVSHTNNIDCCYLHLVVGELAIL